MSRTAWLVITIVGLAAFIVGGGVALVDDGSRTLSASDAPAVMASSYPPALESPLSAIDPSVSLFVENEGDERGHAEQGKAKGHGKKGHEGHGKAKGHDKKGHDGHGKAHGHQGEED